MVKSFAIMVVLGTVRRGTSRRGLVALLPDDGAGTVIEF
jgi:hypothetical protein